MKGKKLSMREIRKILQYRLELHVSAEKTAQALHKSKGVIIETLKRFHHNNLQWPLPSDMTDSALEAILYPPKSVFKADIVLPDMEYIKKEMQKPHVTLQRLFEEYAVVNPTGLKRSSFFRYIQKMQPVDVSMRNLHNGGEILYSDYSGDSLSFIDLQSGELVKTQLFACCWGASSYSYIEARLTQKEHEFTSVHVNSFKYFGVIPKVIVPDNTKSAVTKADRYDPVINAHFGLMCDHYAITVLPARVRKPKDKAVVESNVLHIQRFILARLRNRQFFSLQEINDALWDELEIYNDLPMKDYGGLSRRQRFEANDLPYASPLPLNPFTIAKVKDKVKVARDYHIQVDKHYYSVPYHLVGKYVQTRQSGAIVEAYYDNERVAIHQLSQRVGSFTTKTEHMPKHHQYVKGWSSGYFLDEASKIGDSTRLVIEKLLKRSDHVEHGYRTSRGVLHLAKVYSNERLEKACERVLVFKNVSIASIKSVLAQGIDKQPLLIRNTSMDAPVVLHENIRGLDEFKQTLQQSN